MNNHNQLIKNILKEPLTEACLNRAKRKFCKENKTVMPTNSQLLLTYHKLLKQKIIDENINLENLLKKRSIRTLSGVAPIAVLTKAYPCPGKCIYCPTQKNMPKSYLNNEPAVMRAILNNFHPAKQVEMRIRALKNNGHDVCKIELIVMGGTWSYFPKQYQTWFIKKCFDAVNNKKSKNLEQAQKINETAKYRIVGLTLETRPDFIDQKEIQRMRELGCTRVEIGVQSIYDKILKFNKRGHLVKKTIEATKLLKQAGLKISYHLMPNLPGSTPTKDLKMFKEIFSSPDFQPDLIKIYPCVVVKGSELYRWWKQKKYKPYSDKALLKLLVEIKKIIPYYTRITRLIRDIPSESIEAGNKISNLRQMCQAELEKQNQFCKCIRCREARKKTTTLKNAKLFIEKYPASDGIEYFLSYEDKKRKTLFAFLRLRFNSKEQTENNFIQELKDACIIRELHTYGQLVPMKSVNTKSVQHIGFGKLLMREAKKIAKKNNYKKIAVISGIGVREYYKKLGYGQNGNYMVKNI